MLFDIHQNVVFTDVHTADELMLAVVEGRKLLQLICSISGMGKSARAKKLARLHRIVPEKDSDRPGVIRRGGRFIEDRPKGAISLVRTLWHCHCNDINLLLLDDPGRLAHDEDACDILKLGFGMQRTVSYRTPEISRNAIFKREGRTRYDPSIPDERFVLALLRMLWLSNTNFTDPSVIAKLGDHFAPLVARGLNPFWIRDDRENDNFDLFTYVWWEATENKLLRGLGFPYRISTQAVNFYVAHSADLIDLSPRSLELICHAFANPIVRARDAELASMLSKRGPVRPHLKLPAAWVGQLLWPDTPPRPSARPQTPSQEPEPDPEPDPEPPPASRAKPPEPEPEPQPQPPVLLLPAPTPSSELPDLDVDQSQDDEPVTVICLPDRSQGLDTRDARQSDQQPLPEPPWRLALRIANRNLTTEAVLGLLLRQCGDWNSDDYEKFARFLLQYTWHKAAPEQQRRITDHVYHCTGSMALVYGADAVIEIDGATRELRLISWADIGERLAPAIAKARAEDDLRRRQHMGRQILATKLPRVRKLRKVRVLLDQLLALELPHINEKGRRGLAAVQVMQTDADAFADCKTFEQYVLRAGDTFVQPIQGL